VTFLKPSPFVPKYRGRRWVGGALPTDICDWPESLPAAMSATAGDWPVPSADQILDYAIDKPWVWPSRMHLFFTDLHADADALARALVLSGGVEKTGPGQTDFVLTPAGRDAKFVIGGDCFDKGPRNLALLRALRHVMDLGAETVLLAGNHDIRTWIGLVCAGQTDPRHAHLFARMGKKTVPLFREIYRDYIAGGNGKAKRVREADAKALLLPGDDWYRDFPGAVSDILSEKKIARELKRIREKSADVEEACAKMGLTFSTLFQALEKARELFVAPDGEFSWFFRELTLAYRAGSFLMVHAGVDDEIAAALRLHGVDGVNAAFAEALNGDLFALYNGPLGNTFRTKYRDSNPEFTEAGLADMHAAGFYAIVHGHRSSAGGQQITMRNGMLNFECDASVDAGTRANIGLRGPGGAVTVIDPDAKVYGISTDYPLIKMFDGARYCRLTTIV
jgi:hypothetical protein